jgi:hypothetical protein
VVTRAVIASIAIPDRHSTRYEGALQPSCGQVIRPAWRHSFPKRLILLIKQGQDASAR